MSAIGQTTWSEYSTLSVLKICSWQVCFDVFPGRRETVKIKRTLPFNPLLLSRPIADSLTERAWPPMKSLRTADRREPLITYCDRMDNGIVVGFDDGKAAYYSAALLHAALPQAKMMPSDSEDSGLPQDG